MPFISVICDACVLYPAGIRDLLIRLSRAGLFHARWTDAIHDEWTRALLRKRPELKDKLARTRQLMDEAVRDCLVTGYEHLIPTLVLPDPDDRHVLAAAIHAEASGILTFDRPHFPAATLLRYGLEPIHPDDFVSGFLVTAERTVCETVSEARADLTKAPVSAEELLAAYEQAGLKKTAARLRQFEESL